MWGQLLVIWFWKWRQQILENHQSSRVPGMRQLKNKGLWELKDGGFCDPTREKRV